MICEIAIMQKPTTSSGNKNGKTGEGAGHALPWPIEMLSPRSLRPGPRNARTHSKKQIQQIADSMVRFGVVNPLVADENGRIVAGHARAEAARLLGLKLVPVIRVSHLSDTEIRAYMLADNKIAEKAGWDRELLAVELEELQIALPEIGLDLGITGFEPGEVDSIMLDFAEGRNNPADQVPELDAERRVAQTGDLSARKPPALSRRRSFGRKLHTSDAGRACRNGISRSAIQRQD
jgi:ParB-like chromosome segregation protein Spo0J